MLAALARDRRLALDGQALVRPAQPGPLRLDADFDPALLRHVTVLKLAEDEAEVLGGEERLAALGVPEVVVTLGSRGSLVVSAGRRDRVPVRRIEAPTRPVPATPSSPATSGRGPAGTARSRRRGMRARPPRARSSCATSCAGTRSDRHVATVEGTVAVDVEDELVLGSVDTPVAPERVPLQLPRLIAASASAPRSSRSSTAGRRSSSPTTPARPGARRAAACPAGFAVAIHPDDPDRVLFAARNRLYLSVDGGRFWRALEPELPDIEAVAWA